MKESRTTSKSKRLKKPLVLLLAVLLALTLPLTACESGAGDTGGADDDNASSGKTVVISLAAAWDNLNVFDYGSDYAAYVKSQVFDKLVILNDDGTLRPRLLESWELSENGTVLTAKLNPNAAWQDGESVTAEDIVFTYGLFTNPDVTTTARTTLVAGTDENGYLEAGKTLGVRAIDEKTVEFTTKQRTQDLLFFSDADKFYILPKHLLADADPATIIDNQFFANPVGSGPFKFVSQTIGSEAVLEANPSYFLGSPDFDRLVIRVVSNDNALSGLLSGEISATGGTGIGTLPYNDWKIAQSESSLETKSLPHLGQQLIILNTTSPALTDAQVRKALELAINKQSIIDSLYGGEALALYGPILPTNSYYNQDLKKNEYDPEQAKQLLDAADFDYGYTLRVFVPAGVTEREKAAVLIQQDFAAVGIKAEINVVEFAALADVLYGDNTFDLCFMGYTPTAAPNASGSWYAPSAQSVSHFLDPTIFTEYTLAEQAATDVEARQHYNKAQELIEEYVPYIYLYSPNNLIAHSANITNIDYGTYFLTDTVYEWKVE
ncbi:MAG: peptide ABC transporter substrate-binding protein [Coriobacteriales bacterium]|jgi:peptide/nickel transport system substrate-binding protein|nr:peptide ABC transporter substrate-binding protein [Coriobacteriales bacterium]